MNRLKSDDVKLIKQMIDERKKHENEAKRLSNKRIAEKFEISLSTVDKIISGKTWKGVKA